MEGFNHLDKDGRAVMVDVSGKKHTERTARAEGYINMSVECYNALAGGTVKKGDVLAAARIAGIMALKRTPELIPLCHGIFVEKAAVEFEFMEEERKIRVVCTVKTTGPTGVEMEALTGVSAALLTIYDMCKAVDKAMEINGICLLRKTGGKSGLYVKGDGNA